MLVYLHFYDYKLAGVLGDIYCSLVVCLITGVVQYFPSKGLVLLVLMI